MTFNFVCFTVRDKYKIVKCTTLRALSYNAKTVFSEEL